MRSLQLCSMSADCKLESCHLAASQVARARSWHCHGSFCPCLSADAAGGSRNSEDSSVQASTTSFNSVVVNDATGATHDVLPWML